MPCIDSQLVTHKLNIKEGTKPVKQAPRHFIPKLEIQIKQKIQKLLDGCFINHTASNLARQYRASKEEEQAKRCCIDFRDLNKECPKNEFLLLNIDLLVDATADHLMFSFMDGFNGYNKIRMDSSNGKKIAFRTPMDNFHYTVMPFGLKNVGAIY